MRLTEGIRAFFNDCEDSGRSVATSHFLYVNGKDANGRQVSSEEHLKRGGSLIRITEHWLNMWEFNM